MTEGQKPQAEPACDNCACEDDCDWPESKTSAPELTRMIMQLCDIIDRLEAEKNSYYTMSQTYWDKIKRLEAELADANKRAGGQRKAKLKAMGEVKRLREAILDVLDLFAEHSSDDAICKAILRLEQALKGAIDMNEVPERISIIEFEDGNVSANWFDEPPQTSASLVEYIRVDIAEADKKRLREALDKIISVDDENIHVYTYPSVIKIAKQALKER